MNKQEQHEFNLQLEKLQKETALEEAENAKNANLNFRIAVLFAVAIAIAVTLAVNYSKF